MFTKYLRILVYGYLIIKKDTDPQWGPRLAVALAEVEMFKCNLLHDMLQLAL